MIVERKHPTPIYRQIADHIRSEIETGRYGPGTCIPSEVELTSSYGVGRITLRQAINLLVKEGRLVTKQGKGTFVTAERIDQELVALSSITEVLLAKGVEPSVRVLYSSVVSAQPPVQLELGLGRNANVLEMKRLYLVHGEPLCLIHYYLPMQYAKIAEPLKDESRPMETSYSVFEKAGIGVGEARNIIRAVSADQEVGRYLGIPVSTPVLCLRRTTKSTGGSPLEYLVFYYRADEFEFSVRLCRTFDSRQPLVANGQAFSYSLEISKEGRTIKSTQKALRDNGSGGGEEKDTRRSIKL